VQLLPVAVACFEYQRFMEGVSNTHVNHRQRLACMQASSITWFLHTRLGMHTFIKMQVGFSREISMFGHRSASTLADACRLLHTSNLVSNLVGRVCLLIIIVGRVCLLSTNRKPRIRLHVLSRAKVAGRIACDV
jgi:hypothetical protein